MGNETSQQEIETNKLIGKGEFSYEEDRTGLLTELINDYLA